MTTTTKRVTPHAAAAKQIRGILKTAFPHTTFTVHARSFAGGDAVDVRWIDGPITREVDALIGQYEYGSFDGMQDLYEYTNRRDDIPQVKYVQTQRDNSVAATIATIENINRLFGPALTYELTDYGVRYECDYTHRDAQYCRDKVYRDLHRTSLVCPCQQHPILPGDAYCPECGCAIPAYDPNGY